MRLNAQDSLLLVVDIQERLLPVMATPRDVIHNSARLMQGAAKLDIPILVSEQYPQGIGPTVFDLREFIPEGAVIEKLHFSCAAHPGFLGRLGEYAKKQIVVVGTEAHVCVLQTVLDLKALGYQVFVVEEAISSRNPKSVELAIERMRQNGIYIVNTEMVLFEWLNLAGTPQFKDMLVLIK